MLVIYATGASTVVYDVDVVAEDSVFCDVSLNADDYKISADGRTFTEPELSVRYKFIIRPASEIAERIKTSGANILINLLSKKICMFQRMREMSMCK